MNRPLGDILVDILAETGSTPGLRAVNLKNAASPHIKTAKDCWQWRCDVEVSVNRPSCIERIIGKGETPDDAAADCYRKVLGADRSDWKHGNA